MHPHFHSSTINVLTTCLMSEHLASHLTLAEANVLKCIGRSAHSPRHVVPAYLQTPSVGGLPS